MALCKWNTCYIVESCTCRAAQKLCQSFLMLFRRICVGLKDMSANALSVTGTISSLPAALRKPVVAATEALGLAGVVTAAHQILELLKSPDAEAGLGGVRCPRMLWRIPKSLVVFLRKTCPFGLCTSYSSRTCLKHWKVA